MKLLFLTVIPTPYQRDLFRAIEATGDVDLSVFYYRAQAHDREWKKPELTPFERILDGQTLTVLGPSAHWNPGALQAIEEIAPDLTVVSDYTAPTAQVVMRGLARRKMPFMFWGEVPGFTKRSPVGAAARRLLQRPLSKAAAIAGIGNVAVDAYRELCPDTPVYNIPYFCDLTRFRQAADRAGERSSTVTILFSGQMIPRKGVDLLLAAFDRIARAHPALQLMLLGNGPNRAEYEAMVAPDLSDRVAFLGHQDPSALPDLFARADIFCLPSRHDGWGVVVNEALGAGLPIVVTDTVGAGHDLVDLGCNGYITPVDDVGALATALNRLAGDHSLRRQMAQHSRANTHKWDTDEGARRWIRAATEVLDPSARAR